MPQTQNVGHLAQTTELPFSKATFCALLSLVNAADQNVPPGFGAVSSLTSIAGYLVTSPKTAIGGYRVQLTGDAANVAGQTISVRLVYLRAGVLADVPGSIVETPISTTAGQKNGGKDFAAFFQAQAGDVIRAILTPSAALTAAVSDAMISLA